MNEMTETENKTENKTEKPTPRLTPKPTVSKVNLRLSQLNTESSKKEWVPAPGFEKATSPVHDCILTLFGANKWFQICQICLIALGTVIFLLERFFEREVEFAYIYTAALSAFYLPQVIYCCFYKKAINSVDVHYTRYAVVDMLPVSEIANRLKVEKLHEKATKCFTSSLFGLALSLILVVSAILMDAVSSVPDLQLYPRIIFWGFFIPSVVVWCAIHYGLESIAVLALLVGGAIIDNVCEFLISPYIVVLVAVVLICTRLCQVSKVLRLFAVYMSVVFIFVFQIATVFSPPRDTVTYVTITVALCLASAIITYIVKACCRVIDCKKQQSADEPQLYTEPTSEKVMNFLYSYVWGGLCAVLFVVSIIMNLCSDKYNWFEYSMKKMKPSPDLMMRSNRGSDYGSSYGRGSRYNSDYGSSYGSGSRYNSDYGSSYGRGSRYNSDYGNSYGSGSRYNSDYGSSYGSGSRYDYNSYDY